MSPNEYLADRLKKSAQTIDSKKVLKNEELKEFIFKTLMSKKFRKWGVGDEYTQEVKDSAKYVVEKDIPLNTTWFFGGYKLWSLPSSPEADWAEFFAISYLLRYIAPIAQAHQPGVAMTFWAAHPSIMKRQSNIPEEECRTYHESFRKLIAEFQPHLPANIKLELRGFDELYPDEKEYTDELEPLIKEVEKEYEAWPQDRKDKKRATSVLNIQWNGAEDLEKLSVSEKEARIKNGPIVHDGYCRLSKINQVIRGLGKIDLTATPLPKRNSITVGTTSSSVAKFWAGVGVLERKGDSFSDRILSPKQFQQKKDAQHEVVPSNLIKQKNFQKIWIFPES